jgi:hypothetical protein
MNNLPQLNQRFCLLVEADVRILARTIKATYGPLRKFCAKRAKIQLS